MNETGAVSDCEDCDTYTVEREHVRTLFDHVGDGLEEVLDVADGVYFISFGFETKYTIHWKYWNINLFW